MDQQQSENIIGGEVRMDEPIPSVTRQDIMNFPFPYKLWLIVHLDYCKFIGWNGDGTVVLLDLMPLEDYLNSTRSIFKIKTRFTFLEHLEQFKFERLNATPEVDGELLLQYKNENFQRQRLDLVAKIRRHNVTNGCQPTSSCLQAEPATKKTHRELVAERMPGDMCFMAHGALSSIQKSRLRLKTILNFQNATRILQEKLQASAEGAAAQTQQSLNKPDPITACTTTNAAGLIQPEEKQPVVELPLDMFENPHDSVMRVSEAFRTDYSGYYGNCSKKQIMRFFGDYLPRYEDGSIKVKKVVAAIGSVTQNSHTPDVKRGNEEQIVPEEQKQIVLHDEPIVSVTTPVFMPQTSMPLLNYPTLEPIFKVDDVYDENQTYTSTLSVKATNNTDIDMKVSMDEFFKLKVDDNVDQMKMEETVISSPDLPQMASAAQIEIDDEENSGNETNFRSFCNQYRSAFNWLYEDH